MKDAGDDAQEETAAAGAPTAATAADFNANAGRSVLYAQCCMSLAGPVRLNHALLLSQGLQCLSRPQGTINVPWEMPAPVVKARLAWPGSMVRVCIKADKMLL